MIDPDIPKTIRFRDGDVPELPDTDSIDIEARHAEEQQRKQETLRWLTEHCDWQPFGGEW